MKKKNPTKNRTIRFRASEFSANRIEWLAKTYAEGNVSLWLEWAALNAPRFYITKADLQRRGGSRKRARP